MLAVEDERLFVHHVRHRHVGRQPPREVGELVAHVIAAEGAPGQLAAIAMQRPQAHAHARRAGDGPHAAHQHQRVVDATVLAEARRVVGDLHRIAIGIFQPRHQHRGIGDVVLRCRDLAFQLDRVTSVARMRRLQQGAERRVAVEAWHARPHHFGPRVDQRREAAVADQGQFQRTHAVVS